MLNFTQVKDVVSFLTKKKERKQQPLLDDIQGKWYSCYIAGKNMLFWNNFLKVNLVIPIKTEIKWDNIPTG